MSWRRSIEGLLLGAITPMQVLACRWQSARRVSSDTDRSAAILVVRCEAKIGDNLLNIPFLRAVRAAFPGRPIHLLHHAAARDIYRRAPMSTAASRSTGA
jgi:hypothetical protein